MSSAAEARQGTAASGAGELRMAAALRRGFRQAQVLMAHSLAEYDLGSLSYQLLLEVAAAGAPGVAQGDLTDLLQCPDTRVSTLVRDLAERGLVKAVRTLPDRRAVTIRPTPRGVRLTQAALHSQRVALNRLSEQALVPGVMALLEDALRLYVGLEVRVEGVPIRSLIGSSDR
ncbi:MAG: MarR family winged helix-turn-helix transcriptional regulator [Candidatus Dormibacteria bacterium]